ncbi:MAG: DMT family transporter [candidate division Zixibacteria bacterium]|nr:DMT family transporter [candidate division Zixibacteria bacterium]MDH3939051.1 DMT family transporter [candidate division Zixibacteria bacterium]
MTFRKIVLPFITSFLFAGSFVAGKYTNIDLGPLTTTLLRYLIALLFLACLLFKYGRDSLKVRRKDLWQMFLLGAFGVVGYHYFFFSSLLYTDAANSAIINATNPIYTGTLAALFLGERLSLRNYLGVLVAMAGVLFLLVRGDLSVLTRFDFNRGEILMLLGVFCWVIYSLMIKGLSKTYSGFTLTWYAAVFGVVQLLVLVFLEQPVQQVQQLSTASVLSLLYMGILASGVGYYLFVLSIQEIGPTRTAGSVYSTVPVFVAGLALMFFGEQITWIMGASSLAIIVGLRFALVDRPINSGPRP